MSCISASLDRVYESTVSFTGNCATVSICTSMVSLGEASLLSTERPKVNLIKDNIHIGLRREGVIKCIFTYICDTNIQQPYLEISPEVIWVYSNVEATNDVFSNITWHIN